jgi:phosphoglycolate phosphatase-like HAD superfamily hydrolase
MNLTFRCLLASDAAWLTEMGNDPEAAKYALSVYPRTEHETEQSVKKELEGQEGKTMIEVARALKAILFDLDGTIFDIAERDAFARCEALNELGYKVSLEEVRNHYRYGLGHAGIVEKLGIKLTEKEEKKHIMAAFEHFTTKEAFSLTKIHKGAYDVLSTLSSSYTLAIVTSRDSISSTMEELDAFAIRKFFKLVVTRESAASHYGVKEMPLLPFPEQRRKLYETAIDLMKTDPKDMLCVGDSVSELQPAKELGMNTLGVLTGLSSREDMEKASIPTISNLNELLGLLT